MGILEKLKGKKTLDIFDLPEVKDNFCLLWTRLNDNNCEVAWDIETTAIKRLAAQDTNIREATAVSAYAALMDIAVQGVSIVDPGGKPLAYFMPAKAVNVGTKENPLWEKRVKLSISPYGELHLRKRAGHIKEAYNVVYVYDGDDFEVVNGVPHHISRHKGKKIIAAWMKILTANNNLDYKILYHSDMMAIKSRSDQQKNDNWIGADGDPTPGMWRAKTIKHAFATYPKLRLGMNTVLDTETPENETMAMYADMMAGAGVSEHMQVPDDYSEPEHDDENDQQQNQQQQQPQQSIITFFNNEDIF